MKKPSLTVRIAIALALGILAGIGLQRYAFVATDYIRPVGTVYLNLIKMIVVPVVTLSVIQGVLSLQDVKKVGAVGGRTLGYFLCTTAIAVTLGLVIANILQAGAGQKLTTGELSYEAAQPLDPVQTFVNIFPDNIIAPFAQASMLQVIVVALLFGFGILKAGEKGAVAARAVESLGEVSFRVMDWILQLSPIGVFALICPVVAQQGAGVLLPLLQVVLAAYLGYLAHILLVYAPSVALFGRISPWTFLKQMRASMLFAFGSASSVGALPFNMTATERLGVPRSVSGFVLPLGATVNMDGTAIYQGVCAVFVARIFGVELDLVQQLTVVLTAVLASVGTAGVPGSGMIMLAMVLQSVGLPVEGIALVAGIDRILDMGRTVVNVTGDAACCVCVHAWQKKKIPSAD